MEICELKRENEKEWDEYVLQHHASSFYHQIGWKYIVEKSYGHKPYYLLAKDDEGIKGILPLFSAKNIIIGNKLVSVPFAPYGGVCADDETVEHMLVNEAKGYANKLKVDYLEFRNHTENKLEFITNKSYYTLILNLNSNPMLLWNNFRKSMRRYIKNAIKNNLMVENNPNYIEEFYNLYSRTMQDLGTPVHGYSFFKNILEKFPSNTNISIVRYNDEPIGAVLLLYFKDTVIYGWGGSNRKYLDFSPNYILFWELIKQSCEKKFHYFDFGRSQIEDGTYLFKTGWGAEPKQLYYQYHLYNSKNIPDLSKSNSKRKKFAGIWKKLPKLLTNKIGPTLRGNIP